MRAVFVCLILAATVSPSLGAPKKSKKDEAAEKAENKAAKAEDVPPPRTRSADDDKALEILKRIEAGPDRKAAIAALVKIAPHAVEQLGEWVARPHTVSVDQRRAALVAIDAAVPDAKGKFADRKRQSAKEMKADDEIDWQAKLLELPAGTAGLGEVISDIAALRALSLTKDIRAAQLIFDAAFRPETMIYRDECGRYVRKMEPYSIPAITREAQGQNDRRRYATWQLERLDRQDPIKALNAATGSEELKVSILEVFRDTKLREAVRAVWLTVNDDAPRVRAAARETWMSYITGPAPRAAPKARLKLPGGKLTKKEKPLWLTYRELADNELRVAANELLHEDYPIEDENRLDDHDSNVKVVKIDLEELTKRLFDYYDGERKKQERDQWSAAKAKADAGDLPSAIAMIDRLIATDPERAEKAEMAKLYGQYGKALEAKEQWGDASAAYSKAHGLDPQGSKANDILAAHHYTLGKALEAQGKDGGPDFRKAQQLKPDFAPAVIAAAHASSNGKPTWMLFAAGLAAVAAGVLFAMAMLRRHAA